jgi:hypothetical protein
MRTESISAASRPQFPPKVLDVLLPQPLLTLVQHGRYFLIHKLQSFGYLLMGGYANPIELVHMLLKDRPKLLHLFAGKIQTIPFPVEYSIGGLVRWRRR